ncbi:MAG: nucleotidyltransferase family protein [Saprospiraceae bacterium]
MKLTTILLAAGLSRRMGEKNKLFLPIMGKTMLEATLDNLLLAGVGDIIVVLGHGAAQAKALLKNREVMQLENPAYVQGMTTSIQAGIRAAPAGSGGFMICLADMPLISAEEYKLLATAFSKRLKEDDMAIVQPVYQGQRGNPVIFSSRYSNAMLKLEHLEGCRPIVQENRAHLTLVDMQTPAVLQDADDERAFQELLAAVRLPPC